LRSLRTKNTGPLLDVPIASGMASLCDPLIYLALACSPSLRRSFVALRFMSALTIRRIYQVTEHPSDLPSA
jgi:hypothetical protein